MNYKESYSFEQKKAEATRIMNKYPTRVPILVSKGKNCRWELDREKYLVPDDLTVGQFMWVIRKRLKLPPEEALFMLVGWSIPASNQMLGYIYDTYHDDDGFLYITYDSEGVFGCNSF
jgi:GABA(A) receptor-associated protein